MIDAAVFTQAKVGSQLVLSAFISDLNDGLWKMNDLRVQGKHSVVCFHCTHTQNDSEGEVTAYWLKPMPHEVAANPKLANVAIQLFND
jgi:hypothetical protein